MYRSGPNFEFGEKPVPKWYVPKWSCTELALTHVNTKTKQLIPTGAVYSLSSIHILFAKS